MNPFQMVVKTTLTYLDVHVWILKIQIEVCEGCLFFEAQVCLKADVTHLWVNTTDQTLLEMSI